jgi:hypothetical protein
MGDTTHRPSVVGRQLPRRDAPWRRPPEANRTALRVVFVMIRLTLASRFGARKQMHARMQYMAFTSAGAERIT